jgi:hypothetical protein
MAAVFQRPECRKVTGNWSGSFAWRCGADGALGDGGERMELWFD